MTQTYIKVKDRNGLTNKWVIEYENNVVYEVYSLGIITYLYKSKCYCENGVLYSVEVRNNDYQDYVEWFDLKTQEDSDLDYGYLESDEYGMEELHDEEGRRYYV